MTRLVEATALELILYLSITTRGEKVQFLNDPNENTEGPIDETKVKENIRN